MVSRDCFVAGFTVRLPALHLGWEEPLAKEPWGVYQHSDGRPPPGRKIADKSQRELRDLGLAVEKPRLRHRRLGSCGLFVWIPVVPLVSSAHALFR